MAFIEVIDQVIALLRSRARISYRVLKREFALDDEQLEDLKAELIDAQRVARDEDGKVLVWIGEGRKGEADKGGNGKERLESDVQSRESKQGQGPKSKLHSRDAQSLPPNSPPPAERRQLTVMFCDLVGSTALSTQLDPEDLREVVRTYQQTCSEVIQRYDGHIAQYLGDGLLVYFGYPVAHEDDARRAVRAGLEIVEAIRGQGTKNGEQGGRQPLQLRIGIHTGLVVIGDIGPRGRTEQLALGETPNIAARIQGLAEPNTVIISAATQRLIEGRFESQPFGSHVLKGIATPIAVYHVQSERQSVAPLISKTTLTPLVGREQEVGLLIDRWVQAKEGRGQVVLLSGEPGIGKSRLAYTLREQVTAEGSLLYEARCSPYHQHSALYPLIEVMQRTLLFTHQDTEDEKVQKLERALTLYNLQETVPLFTVLFSLPTPSHYAPLAVTPQKQKERTLQAFLQVMMAQAERQVTVSVWEDLHWADPSSLEFLSLLIEQIPTTKLLLVLTFRPEFTSPWKPRSHISHLVLNRLGKKQVEAMIEKAAAGKPLPTEVIEQIRVKTDGVPLFVEELTKSVVESVESMGSVGSLESLSRLPLPLAIPATLQEALLARLDRLSTARQVAQLAATLGREFSYELLQAVASISEADLQNALAKLVDAEILYQRGVGEQSRYFFKHALIQDTAYQSLLKSTRQQYHTQIAKVLEDRFPDTKESQPELLAHHYTEAGLIEQAIPYWQQAGERAIQRSAHVEAVSHLTKGLELLKTLTDTPEHAQQELVLQVALGEALMVTKSFSAPEAERAYARAQELCQQVGETPQLFPVLSGLRLFHMARAEWQPARELGEQLLRLAQKVQDPALLLGAHHALGDTIYLQGELTRARVHQEHAIALYHPEQHHALAFGQGYDLGMDALAHGAWLLWYLGYPDQALQRSQAALALARKLSHTYSVAHALWCAAWLHQLRREAYATQEHAEATIALATEHGFVGELLWATMHRGWALVEQGREEEGIAQMHQGLTALSTSGAEVFRPGWLATLGEAYGKVGQVEKGLGLVAEALAITKRNEERLHEAELYRLKGALTLQSQIRLRQVSHKSKASPDKSEDTGPQPLTPSSQSEAEACFLKAIEVARTQQAKSLELRASTSLAHLWQQQGKTTDAHILLSEVYNWFTEGFDTKDLQEAKALLEELSD